MPSKTKSANPAYPDAHPTAPGGMSKAALRLELAEKHGIKMDDTRDTPWPRLIDMVIEERKAREQESATRSTTEDEHEEQDTNVNDFDPAYENEVEREVEDMFDDLDDLDDLLAEFADDGEDDEDDEVINEGVDEEPIAEAREDADASGAETAAFDGDDPFIEDSIIDPEVMFAEMSQARAEEQAENPPLFLGIPGIRDYVFDGHAGAGPSASERWMTCTMSLTASRRFLETLSPNQQAVYAGANTAARQGTTAHAAAEVEANAVLGRIDQSEVDATLLELTVMPESDDEAYTDEMGEYITEYVDLVQSYATERGADRVMIEARVEAAIPLAEMHEGEVYVIRGSADCAVLPAPEGDGEGNLVVADLKYGNGLFVDVEENSQVRIYALGVLDLLTDDEGDLITDVETVTYYIAQPRLGGLRTWTESLDDLLDWRDEVLSPALTKALYGEAEGATFEPSEVACQFCPARGTCPALAEQRMEQAAEAFTVIQDAEFADGPGAFPETATLTDTRLGELLEQIGGLVSIYGDLKEEAQRRLHRGEHVPGFILVNYTPPRKWKDDAQSALDPAVHHDEGAVLTVKQRKMLWRDPVLMTPTQAEKILGEDYAQIEALVEKPDRRPVIAKEGDRRKPWEGNPPEQMFPDLTDEEKTK